MLLLIRISYVLLKAQAFFFSLHHSHRIKVSDLKYFLHLSTTEVKSSTTINIVFFLSLSGITAGTLATQLKCKKFRTTYY